MLTRTQNAFTRIALNLYQRLVDNIGHVMPIDRYYISISLANQLLKMEDHLFDSFNHERKGLSSSIKKPKFLKADLVDCRNNNTLLLS